MPSFAQSAMTDPQFLCQLAEPEPLRIASTAIASTVRAEFSELHSPFEEAKADIVGLWALHYMLDKSLLDTSLKNSMYVTYLAGSIRTMRFGLKEAHGKGQALQFNYLLEKGGFIYDPNTSVRV